MTTNEIIANANKMVEFLKNNGFNFSALGNYNYKSLPICIIDCVYSLRAPYASTQKVVDRYVSLGVDDGTVSNFINYVDSLGTGERKFEILADKDHLGNRQKLALILKARICYYLAVGFRGLGIDTLDDFKKASPVEMECLIISLKGLDNAAKNYMFMLTGDQHRVKVDTHITKFVADSCGCDNLNDEEYQNLFKKAVKILKKEYSTLDERGLDHIVWDKYSRKPKKRKSSTVTVME